MLYAILCYNEESFTEAWSTEHDAAVMKRLTRVTDGLAAAQKLGPVARLEPTTTAATLKKGKDEPIVVDGPFAETKEQLLGFYIVDCADIDEALNVARDLSKANPGPGSYEIRPVKVYQPQTGGRPID